LITEPILGNSRKRNWPSLIIYKGSAVSSPKTDQGSLQCTPSRCVQSNTISTSLGTFSHAAINALKLFVHKTITANSQSTM